MPQHHLAYHMISCHIISCHIISYHMISYHIISSPFILEWTISYYIFPGNLIPNPPKSTALQSFGHPSPHLALQLGFPNWAKCARSSAWPSSWGTSTNGPRFHRGWIQHPQGPRFFPLRKGPFQQERIQIPSYHVSICFTIFQLVVGGRQSTYIYPLDAKIARGSKLLYTRNRCMMCWTI